jgi:hypothetical protein
MPATAASRQQTIAECIKYYEEKSFKGFIKKLFSY